MVLALKDLAPSEAWLGKFNAVSSPTKRAQRNKAL